MFAFSFSCSTSTPSASLRKTSTSCVPGVPHEIGHSPLNVVAVRLGVSWKFELSLLLPGIRGTSGMDDRARHLEM